MLRPTVDQSPAETFARAPSRPERSLLSAWLALFAFWLLLSGFFTPFLIAAGAGCALAVVWLGHRMAVVDREGHPIHLSLRMLFSYWPWLAKEIVKSGWEVSCAILRPRLAISPTVTRFEASQTTDLGLVIHANSITLTPGTICVAIEGRELLVHALLESGAASQVTGSEMDRRVAALEGRT